MKEGKLTGGGFWDPFPIALLFGLFFVLPALVFRFFGHSWLETVAEKQVIAAQELLHRDFSRILLNISPDRYVQDRFSRLEKRAF